MVDEIGVLKPGARADLLVIDGNPVANLDLLQQGGRFMDIIMKDGTFIKHNTTLP